MTLFYIQLFFTRAPSPSPSLSLLPRELLSSTVGRRYKLMKCRKRKRSTVPLKITSVAYGNNRRDGGKPSRAHSGRRRRVFIADSIYAKTVKVVATTICRIHGGSCLHERCAITAYVCPKYPRVIGYLFARWTIDSSEQ